LIPCTGTSTLLGEDLLASLKLLWFFSAELLEKTEEEEDWLRLSKDDASVLPLGEYQFESPPLGDFFLESRPICTSNEFSFRLSPLFSTMNSQKYGTFLSASGIGTLLLL
jgi:hypothetical protein